MSKKIKKERIARTLVFVAWQLVLLLPLLTVWLAKYILKVYDTSTNILTADADKDDGEVIDIS
jgi:hypothetical protein